MAYELNELIKNLETPPRIKRLPISEKGWYIPWFVHIDENGVADFRVIGRNKIIEAYRLHKCWLCGDRMGTHLAFTIGPMCVVNRVTSEPPSHLACAEYAVKACPFLSNPRMRRNEVDLPEEGSIAGIHIPRNPGATAIYLTKTFKQFKAGAGVLFSLGEPERVLWYASGRAATREEVQMSINSGMPILETEARKDNSLAELHACLDRAQKWLPA